MVEQEENQNLKIEYMGKIGDITPKIKKLEVSNTTNEIKVKVIAKYAANGTYKYYIKEKQTDNYEEKQSTASNEYVYNNLKQNTTYYIKVEVINEKGTAKAEQEVIRITETVEGLTDINTTFTYSPEEWTNQNVTATVNTTVTGYTLQTSKDGKTWETKNSQIYSENGTIYARLVDSTNQANGYASGNISNIDKEKPIITELIPNTATNELTIKANDQISGIVGYQVTTENSKPTIFIECENTNNLNINVSGKTQGNIYYVWAKDKVGNISNCKAEYISTSVALTHIHTGNSSTGGGCYKNGYHTHKSSCYGTTTVWVDDYCYGGNYWSEDAYAICKDCDGERWQHPIKRGSHAETTTSLICGNSPINTYSRNCNLNDNAVMGNVSITKDTSNGYKLIPSVSNLNSGCTVVSYIWDKGQSQTLGECIATENGTYTCTITYNDKGINRTVTIPYIVYI